ncbi:AIG2-like family protein [Sporomusa ovata DSM 2662]|uniref:Gamma-glutamylcyclotransferase AIG2-like domain-containing protein n=1 Tax=Sporomusa ovata TaxID=2378 RepID=A0A0U1L3W5_9FIRM|nr:gamma-glutamylcyclotransferase [Sporomusa ovata]EQB25240.1 hypothetical protein SOV_5c04080 [Sporomusa ovata DSM 2662]CQR73803.1 hypothetical protein SpAn4DRAFT_0265 [Sporomusa ovata]
METKIYAAYGSNLNLKQMKKRCPKTKVIGKGELFDYKLTFRGKQTGVANVERNAGCSVPVVLWTITKDCEQELDRYEGYPRLYGKEVVTVSTADGERAALVYVMARQYETMPVIPSEYYFEIIRQGYRDNGIDIEPIVVALSEAKAEILI